MIFADLQGTLNLNPVEEANLAELWTYFLLLWNKIP
ncbi:hypothetical protein Desor_1060 [Desulfosporosinus orientis DSM 765]|uniref:Uncharacterized protein n=1 Tax=Desulfosporosinus orientis (strain ATCC 19365 / DSM 765 / NCIMB 8382 / VKM B-1628 / Singapore I) TaxID=768706 RepID=G7W888_DESOD|nr:hypothetical protein Desor_1060 [Desulfosporosinus orientis DSM 765]